MKGLFLLEQPSVQNEMIKFQEDLVVISNLAFIHSYCKFSYLRSQIFSFPALKWRKEKN